MKVPDRISRAYTASQEMKRSEVARDTALLVARVGLAWIFVYHGACTPCSGRSAGPVYTTRPSFTALSPTCIRGPFSPSSGGQTEPFGGIVIGLGIFGRLAALGLVGEIAMAMATVYMGAKRHRVEPDRRGIRAEPGSRFPGFRGRGPLGPAACRWTSQSECGGRRRHPGRPPATGGGNNAEVERDGRAQRVATP